jgi:hypothetical protein
MEDPNEDRSVS